MIGSCVYAPSDMNELQKRSLSVHVCERVCVKCSRLCRQDDGCRQHSVHAYGGPSGRCWHHESACRGSAPRLNSNVSLMAA